MDGPRDHRTKGRKLKQDKYMVSLICEISDMIHMNLSTKQEQTLRHREQTWGCQGEEAGGLGLTDANYHYRIDQQWGPTLLHRELYSISCTKA